MFAAIKNGSLSKRSFILCRKKKTCADFLKILWSEGYILGYSVENDKLKIYLKYVNNVPAIKSLNTISKPGRRIYLKVKQIWKIDSNKNFIIFSTSKGFKTIVDCKKLKIGGEPILIIN